MGSICKEILIVAGADEVWSAVRNIVALHTRLVPGFVTDTRLEPDARIVTFGNGMVLREPIIAINDDIRRLVWSAALQFFAENEGSTRLVSTR
jgi:hypothetical protein